MRWRIGLGILLVTGLGLGLKLRLLSGLVGEETLGTVAAIDAAVAVLLLIFSIAALTGHLSYLRELVRHLHMIGGGRRDLRMPVRGDGLAAELGQGINALLGAVVPDEGLTSSTPGIRRVVRPGEATDPRLRARILGPVGRAPDPDAPGLDLDEGVGPVRVRPRDGQTAMAHYDTEVSGPPELEARAEPRLDELSDPALQTAEDAARDASSAEDPPAATHDVEADADSDPAGAAARASSAGEDGSGDGESAAALAAGEADDEAILPAEPIIDPAIAGSGSSVSFASAVSLVEAPTTDEDAPDARRSLFDVYLSAKKRLGEDIDAVSYEDFDHELGALESQLKQERGCDDVRFDVRVVDGRVALQPRLVRHKALVS